LIDPRAIVDPSARLGTDVVVGPWSIIGADVELGDGCRIEPHAIVKGPTRLGRNNHVYQFASIGEDAPAPDGGGEPTRLEAGDDNVFREGVTVHRGTAQHAGVTRIGSGCLFMAYVHIGHDCRVGDEVVLASNAVIDSHAQVGDHADFGSAAVVAPYRCVGAFTQVAARSLVLEDVPAYLAVAGNPARAVGLNLEGLRRCGTPAEAVEALRRAYQCVYREGRSLDEARASLAAGASQEPALARFLQSLVGSRWGIVRHGGADDGT